MQIRDLPTPEAGSLIGIWVLGQRNHTKCRSPSPSTLRAPLTAEVGVAWDEGAQNSGFAFMTFLG
jgi:hypothetical protein